MKNHTVVKRYARALLWLGLEDGKFADYGRDLEQLSQAIGGAGEESKALLSPFFPHQVRRKMLDGILEKAGLNTLTSNFVKLLMDNERLPDLPDIAEVYKKMVDEHNGVIRATLTSATDLEDSQIEAIKGALSGFAGRKVELNVTRDPSIIGGLIAQMGDLTIDGSVRTQMNKLAQLLDNQ
ncbi:ATP synthase F1 subunit delta [Deltaproteobacteria bacterium Smac51]|nr:ATP synthase F1 subunit delta [Deltaproteobacteria bacterium Smac51]